MDILKSINFDIKDKRIKITLCNKTSINKEDFNHYLDYIKNSLSFLELDYLDGNIVISKI